MWGGGGGVKEKNIEVVRNTVYGGGGRGGVSLVRVMVGLNLETVLENFRDSKKKKKKKNLAVIFPIITHIYSVR